VRQTTNRRGLAQSEIWFRIVHLEEDGHHCPFGDGKCEQSVEIALGAKGACRKGNVGNSGAGPIGVHLRAVDWVPLRMVE
jgi:hypothetical protein